MSVEREVIRNFIDNNIIRYFIGEEMPLSEVGHNIGAVFYEDIDRYDSKSIEFIERNFRQLVKEYRIDMNYGNVWMEEVILNPTHFVAQINNLIMSSLFQNPPFNNEGEKEIDVLIDEKKANEIVVTLEDYLKSIK